MGAIRGSGIWRRFPSNTALLIGSVPVFLFLIFFAWFRWELPPLQAYYLASYWECSRHPSSGGNVTEIRWLYKSAPGRMSVPLVAQDVERSGWGLVPIRLSPSALANGWTELAKMPQQSWASNDLQNFFERDFYDGQTAQQKLAEPMSLASLVPVLFLVGLLYLRKDIAEEWREFLTGPFGDDPIVDRNALKQALMDRLPDWRSKSLPYVHSKPATDVVSLAATPAVTAVLKGEKSRVNASDNRTTRDSSATRTAKPVQRSIFPGARPSSKPNPPWDVSQWIE